MLQYTIKRLLLTIPTFLFISLLLFLVLNIAPGRPGAANSGQQGESTQQEQKESFRIFKEQFNLDKPILLNMRFADTQEEVRDWLVVAYNLQGTATAAERIEAQETLDDHGNYLVRHLFLCWATPMRPCVRWPTTHSWRPASCVWSERRGDIDAAREQNRVISKRNQVVKDWIWDGDLTEAEQAGLASKWTAWCAEHEGDYTYTTNDKVNAFFFDTRFAKYWSNLIHLDFGVSTADRRPVPRRCCPSSSTRSRSPSSGDSGLLHRGTHRRVQRHPPGHATRLGRHGGAVCHVQPPTFFTGTVLLRLLTEGSRSRGSPRAAFRR